MEQSTTRRCNLYLLFALLLFGSRLAAQVAGTTAVAKTTVANQNLRTVPRFSRRTVDCCMQANTGSPEIENIVLTITQGSDGKEPHTGYRIDVDPGMTSGGNPTPMFTVYTCGMENSTFRGNSTATILLKPDPQFKGVFDLATFQKFGGRIHIWPICYPPNSTSGVGYDRWDITNITMTINLKPSADNPNPQPIGGPSSPQLNWNLNGVNRLELNSQSENEADLYFDSNLNSISI
jgi:hypothetical protein